MPTLSPTDEEFIKRRAGVGAGERLSPADEDFVQKAVKSLPANEIVTSGKGEIAPDWDARREALDALSNGSISSRSALARDSQKRWQKEHSDLALTMRELPGPVLLTLAMTGAGRAALYAAEAAGAPALGEILTGTFGRGMQGLSGIAARTGSRAISGAAQGAISQAIYPGEQGYEGSAAQGAGLNVLMGALGVPLRSHITPETAALAKRYISAGIPLGTSQIPGSPFAARVLARILHLGRSDAGALTKQMIASIGSKEEALSQPVIDAARDNVIAPALNNAARGTGNIADAQFLADERRTAMLAHQGLQGQDTAYNQMLGMMKQIHNAAISGSLDGDVYQNLTQKGSALSNALARESPIRQYAMPLRDALDSALERANPSAASAVRLARNQWRNSVVLEDMLGSKNAVDSDGQINPKFLFSHVASNYSTPGKATQAAQSAANPIDVGTLAEGSNAFRPQPGISLGLGARVGAGTLGAIGLAGLAEHEGLPILHSLTEYPEAGVGLGVLGTLYGAAGLGMNTTLGRNLLLRNAERGGSGFFANPLIPMQHEFYRGPNATRNGIDLNAISPISAAEGADGNTAGGFVGPTRGNADIAQYIRNAASARGIDPDIALRVAQSEGLGGSYTGDSGSSFGPFQLHYGGIASGGNAVPGLGDVFTKATGLHASDPRTIAHQIDFALDYAKINGWSSWHGWKGDPYEGISSQRIAPATLNVGLAPPGARTSAGAVGGGQDYNVLTGGL